MCVGGYRLENAFGDDWGAKSVVWLVRLSVVGHDNGILVVLLLVPSGTGFGYLPDIGEEVSDVSVALLSTVHVCFGVVCSEPTRVAELCNTFVVHLQSSLLHPLGKGMQGDRAARASVYFGVARFRES